MHVGMGTIFQNPGKALPDVDVYRMDLELALQAEALGFDSVWGVEHHFTDYTVCPDPMQFLSFMAGATRKIRLGSMVMVLPWHHPVRAAEQIAMLDNLSGGRLILGIGRGAGRIEFEGFGLDMGESRERFIESATIVLEGLERGFCAFDGKHYRQRRVDIRPTPFRSFRGRTYAAAVSPESMRIVAQQGVGILIIPQKKWADVEREMAEYRQIFRDVNGREAPKPVATGWVFVDESADRAAELAHKYIGDYCRSIIAHYEFDGTHMKNTKGYEFYVKIQDKMHTYGSQTFIDFFVGLQIWGTPEQCIEKIMDVRRRVDNSSFTAVFKFGGMPQDVARGNMALFARTVLPYLKSVETGVDIDGALPALAA